MEPISGQTDEQIEEESGETVRGEDPRRSEDLRRGEDLTTSGRRFVFEQAWMVAACALLIAAALLLYLDYPNAAFVTAALGASAWFLNMRTNLKRKHKLVRQGGRNWAPRDDDEGE